MKRLILVRHGQTEWNAARRLQGQTDIALSDHGRAQARALAPMIASLGPDHAMTSDLARAAETAILIGATATPDRRLREQALGQWEGGLIADLPPEDYRGWRAGQFTPPGGESWTEFRARVGAALGKTVEQAQATALAVCHGGVIRAALDALLGLPPSRIVPVGPGSLCILAFPDGPASARLEAFNLRPGTVDLDAPD